MDFTGDKQRGNVMSVPEFSGAAGNGEVSPNVGKTIAEIVGVPPEQAVSKIHPKLPAYILDAHLLDPEPK